MLLKVLNHWKLINEKLLSLLKLIWLLFFEDTKTTYNISKTKIDFIFTDLFTIKNISENIGLNLKYRYKKHDRNIWKLNNQTYTVYQTRLEALFKTSGCWETTAYKMSGCCLTAGCWLLIGEWLVKTCPVLWPRLRISSRVLCSLTLLLRRLHLTRTEVFYLKYKGNILLIL